MQKRHALPQLCSDPCMLWDCAGALLNALRQQTAQQLRASMDSLVLVTAWQPGMLQVRWLLLFQQDCDMTPVVLHLRFVILLLAAAADSTGRAAIA